VCSVDNDCASDRVCEQGFCVVDHEGTDAGNGVDPDAPPDATPEPDADPFEAIKPMCLAAGYAVVDTADGGLFRTVTQNTKWLDAAADCANDVPGATHLIVLSSQNEVAYMKTQLGWVGLSDRATEGTFLSVTGEPNDLRPFLNGQPDNGGGNENCVQMKSGGLDDDQCGNGHRYVCECDGQASLPQQ